MMASTRLLRNSAARPTYGADPTETPVPTRRDFLKQTSTMAAALAASRLGPAVRAADAAPSRAKRPLEILVLGGTGFLGPCIVRRAVELGHRVTIFNRGKTDPNAFPDLSIEKLVGDRSNGDLKALEGRDFDAVVDVWPSYPKYVREAVEMLAEQCSHYLFISTISVYKPIDQPGADESAPVETLPENADPEKTPVTLTTYGALKVLCEQAAEKLMPGQVTIVRPGLIVGPDDDTDRFTYWPLRIADGGEVLAPGEPKDPVQVIDVRDLGNFVVHCLEEVNLGVMNATGPNGGMPISKMLEACQQATKSDARFTFVPDDFLHEQKINGWSDLPVWVSPREPGGGLCAVSVAKAIEAGLVFRPVVETARDTLDWFRKTQGGRKLRGGLARDAEAKALAAWHAKQGGGGVKRS